MKQKLLYPCLILTIFIFLQCNENQDVNDKSSTLSVKTIIASPQNYVGKKISVVGMVYDIKKDNKGFSLVDLSDCTATCGPATCKVTALPIQSKSSAIPKVGEKVIVLGVISKNDGRYSFALQKVEPYHES